MTTIPNTDSIEARPVYKRLVRRHAGFTMFPPTEGEKHDAILVLRDGEQWGGGLSFDGDLLDGVDPLVVEAQRIMDESSV
jgi:hypothetical protein